MPAPGLIDELRAWLRERNGFDALIVDPGKTCGVCVLDTYRAAGKQTTVYEVGQVALDDLPEWLTRQIECGADAIICEDFSLQQRHNDPKVPSAQGIGVCRAMSALYDTPLFLLQPNTKNEGRKALDQAGLDARDGCRSDHQRDVIDLVGKVLKELRKVQP